MHYPTTLSRGDISITNKKSNNSRRKRLKSIAAGSGAVVAGKTVPENWAKPVIDTVILPAHAVSTPTPPAVDTCDQGWIEGDGNGATETQASDASTRCECDANVRSEEPTANGATWSPEDEYCYAEFGWTGRQYYTKSFN